MEYPEKSDMSQANVTGYSFNKKCLRCQRGNQKDRLKDEKINDGSLNNTH
jgi:hypothetical protein